MANTVQAPSRELSRLAIRIDSGIGLYLRDRQGERALRSPWEAVRHAWTLTNLAVRHAEATVLLARTDVVLAPTAFVTARASMETAARVLWLLEIDDVWDREARWLALLQEGVRLGKRPQLASQPHYGLDSDRLGSFADAVRAKLPPGVNVPRTPSADALLARFGTGLDSFYTISSQYVHGTEFATRGYRSHLGANATYGEMVQLEDWALPLAHVWSTTTAAMVRLMQATDVAFPPALQQVDKQVNEALEQFRQSVFRRTLG